MPRFQKVVSNLTAAHIHVHSAAHGKGRDSAVMTFLRAHSVPVSSASHVDIVWTEEVLEEGATVVVPGLCSMKKPAPRSRTPPVLTVEPLPNGPVFISDEPSDVARAELLEPAGEHQ